MALFDLPNSQAFSKRPSLRSRCTTLLVGLDPLYTRDLQAFGLPDGCDMFFADMGALHPNILAEISPTIVVAPLISDGPDAIETAQALERFEFRGELRLIAYALPKPQVVMQELRAAAPALNITLVQLPRIQP